jgi:hypothetical protein
MSSISLHIRRIVWHGPGAPDATALAAAIQARLNDACDRRPPAGAVQQAAQAIADALRPQLDAARNSDHA